MLIPQLFNVLLKTIVLHKVEQYYCTRRNNTIAQGGGIVLHKGMKSIV